jgi:hypothetical protein
MKKDEEWSDRGVMYGTILKFSKQDWRKRHNSALNFVSDTILTGQFPNTS